MFEASVVDRCHKLARIKLIRCQVPARTNYYAFIPDVLMVCVTREESSNEWARRITHMEIARKYGMGNCIDVHTAIRPVFFAAKLGAKLVYEMGGGWSKILMINKESGWGRE